MVNKAIAGREMPLHVIELVLQLRHQLQIARIESRHVAEVVTPKHTK